MISASALVGYIRSASEGKFPSFVILKQNLDDKDIECSGCLINYNHVLTAASCIANREEKRLTFLGYVIAGTVSRVSCTGKCQWRRVKDLTVHHGFFDSYNDPDNVGVIRVDRPFEGNKNVHPVPPTVTKFSIGTQVLIAGFYKLNDTLVDKLHYGEANLMAGHFCGEEALSLKHVCVSMRTGGLGSPVYQGVSVIGVVCDVNNTDLESGRLTANAVFYRGFIDKFIHSGKYMKFRSKKAKSGVVVMRSKIKTVLAVSFIVYKDLV